MQRRGKREKKLKTGRRVWETYNTAELAWTQKKGQEVNKVTGVGGLPRRHVHVAIEM
ncbi:hypothetical protein M413DRAFT_444932 [Hebeloma cylindrosporum]|uniref:Uncharacterized protein n=1 Tax=Hebeloma cylindrosporum TaxID=76867 RepID=A0A0C3BYN3_HEBCY|nr:hypothetical protein M413DRAFT_447178 [Hebeloma cylindrosporum h7]KIM41690.1 hypothetical protein M413DRAFT_444932 [Hebeloma cylindrosporum h7]